MTLDLTAIRAGVRLAMFDTLGSTNAEALARARSGERGPLWIMARQQTAGRGRRGRTWVSEPGNLYATLLVTDPSPPPRAAELSFVAALAVKDALADIAPALAAPASISDSSCAGLTRASITRNKSTPTMDYRVGPSPDDPESLPPPSAAGGRRLSLKWPNDLLLDGAKVAGILVEGESGPPLAAAIGIGVNCVHHPDAVAYPATDLAAAGVAATPERVLMLLSRTMLTRLAQWDRGAGFAAIRADWLRQAAGVGGYIRVSIGDEALAGRFAGLDAAGHLVLELADGTARTVPAGDAFPVPA